MLALTLAQAANGALTPMRQTPLRQPSLCVGQGLTPRLPKRLQAQGQLFLHSWKNDLFIWVLKHHAGQGTALRSMPHGLTCHPYLTCVRLVQAANEAKQTGFTHAVVTNQTNALFSQLQMQLRKNSGATPKQGHAIQLHALFLMS
jgi:hypothetical protein